MSKVKEMISKTWTNVREGFWRFLPFHVGAAALALCAVLNIHDVLPNHALENVGRGLVWGMLAGVFTRLTFDRYKIRFAALVSWGITLVIAALGTSFWYMVASSSPYYWKWSMLYGGTTYALVAACMAMLYDGDNEHTLFAQLLFNFIMVFVSAAIMEGGLSGCLFAFSSLITSVESELYGDMAAIIMVGIAPIIFMSLLPRRESVDEDSQRAGAFLFKRILPIAVILLAILYIYLIKILVNGSMPAGKLNWFGSIALAIYIFFWLALAEAENKFTRFVLRHGWALLVPVVIAQVVAVWIRYRAYGLTAERMAGMILLMLGFYALVLAALNGSRAWFFRVMAVAGLIFTITPMNFMDVPVRNQECRLRAALERVGCLKDGELSIPDNVNVEIEDAKVIVGAWDYLGRAHTEWYKAEFFKKIAKSSNDDLIERLAIDRSSLGSGRGRRDNVSGSYEHHEYYPKAPIPIEGHKSIRLLDYYRDWDFRQESDKSDILDKRWMLYVRIDGEHEESFDVTEDILTLVAAGGFDKTEATKSAGNGSGRKHHVDSNLCCWQLKPGVKIAFAQLELQGYNTDKIDSIWADSACLLFSDVEK